MGARTQEGQGGGEGEVRALFLQKKPKAVRFWSILTLGTWKAGGLPSPQVTRCPQTLRPRAPGLTKSGGPRAGASDTSRGLPPAGGW